jgi:hypothetical protein
MVAVLSSRPALDNYRSVRVRLHGSVGPMRQVSLLWLSSALCRVLVYADA